MKYKESYLNLSHGTGEKAANEIEETGKKVKPAVLFADISDIKDDKIFDMQNGIKLLREQ